MPLAHSPGPHAATFVAAEPGGSDDQPPRSAGTIGNPGKARTYQCVCGCGPLVMNIYKVKKRNTSREGFAHIVAAVLADVDAQPARGANRALAMARCVCVCVTVLVQHPCVHLAHRRHVGIIMGV